MTDVSPPEMARDEIFNVNARRLAHKARRAVVMLGKDPSEVVTVAISVDDPAWTDLAEALMPDEDWQPYRDRGELPLARGTANKAVLEYVASVVPSLAKALSNPAPEGHVYALVMAGGGASAYVVPWNKPLR